MRYSAILCGNRKAGKTMADDERELSEAEQRRTEAFLRKCEEMEAQGYERTDLIIDMKRANLLLTFISIPFAALSIYLFFLVNGRVFGGLRPIQLILLMLVLTAVHELIHGITWSLYCENGFKDIEFGFILKTFTPYCTCATPLPKAYYVIGALAPLFVLGVVPYIAGLFMGSLTVFFLGIVMILGAGGDIMLVGKLLAFRSGKDEEEIYDHPTEAGSVVFSR